MAKVKRALARAKKYSKGGSVGPAPKSNKLVGEFRDPSERAGGIPWLTQYAKHPLNVSRELGARRVRDPNESYPDFGRARVALADGGEVPDLGPIDALRMRLEAAGNEEPDARKGLTTTHDVLGMLPVMGNVMAASDAYTGARDALKAARAGRWRDAAIDAGLAGVSAAGALSPLPWSARAGRAAREGRDAVNVLIPAMEGPATTRARDMRDSGLPMDRIWKESQRAIDPAGTVRREVPDFSMAVREDLKPGDMMRVGDAVKHPALSNAYPQLFEQPMIVTDAVDRFGKPIVRTIPGSGGGMQLNPSGNVRRALAKLFQYGVNAESNLAQPLRHGKIDLERGLDSARMRADALDPADRTSVDAYLDQLAEARENYTNRLQLDQYSGQGGRSEAANALAGKNAGNVDARIAQARANFDQNDLKTPPYRRNRNAPISERIPNFEDIYSLPPEGMEGVDLQRFIDQWHRYGSGRGKFARGGRVKNALKRARAVTGAVRGKTGGREDALPVDVPAGAYVVPADVVAALGGGNSESGMARLEKMYGKPRRAAGGRVDAVPILISHGEFVLSPEAVERAGGHDALDAKVNSTRKAWTRHLQEMQGPNQ